MIPENLVKAKLREISWDSKQNVVEGKHEVEVQFNPESLKVALSNQNASGDQRGGSSIQYVGAGTSKLSFDLWFDVTSSHHGGGEAASDVRALTNQVVFFITPQATKKKGKFIPPGMRFSWGAFLFEGIVDSLTEDLEYFSEDGRPLRAKLAISMSRQEIRFEKGTQQGGSGLGTTAASGSNQQAADGDGVPDLAGENWAPVAAANGIESPLDLEAGAVLDLSAGIGLEAGASIGGGLSAGASFGGGLSAGASLGGGLSAGGSLGGGLSAGGSLGGGLRAGAAGGAGLGGGIGAGVGGGLGGGIGGGVSGGIGGGVSGGLSAGAGAGTSGGISGGLEGGVSTSGGLTAGASGQLGGAAASASASASASFDHKLRR